MFKFCRALFQLCFSLTGKTPLCCNHYLCANVWFNMHGDGSTEAETVRLLGIDKDKIVD